jgi:hypothetical protein
MGKLVHTGLGLSSLVAHVLPYPPPPPCKQLCTRSCSNKHTHTPWEDLFKKLKQHLTLIKCAEGGWRISKNTKVSFTLHHSVATPRKTMPLLSRQEKRWPRHSTRLLETVLPQHSLCHLVSPCRKRESLAQNIYFEGPIFTRTPTFYTDLIRISISSFVNYIAFLST